MYCPVHGQSMDFPWTVHGQSLDCPWSQGADNKCPPRTQSRSQTNEKSAFKRLSFSFKHYLLMSKGLSDKAMLIAVSVAMKSAELKYSWEGFPLLNRVMYTTGLKQISPSDRALEEQTETRLK